MYHSDSVNATSPSAKEDDAEQSTHLGKGTHIHGLRIAYPEEAVEICPEHGCTIGSAEESHIHLDSSLVRLAPGCISAGLTIQRESLVSIALEGICVAFLLALSLLGVRLPSKPH